MEKSIEAVIFDSFNLLYDSAFIIQNAYMSRLKYSVNYEKTFQDKLNSYKLGEINIICSQIEKLRDIVSSWHPEANRVSEVDIISLFEEGIIYPSNQVSIIEIIAENSLVYDDRDKKIKLAIIAAYNTCRESYFTVNSMIKDYNWAIQKEFGSKAKTAEIEHTKLPKKKKKIVPLRMPKILTPNMNIFDLIKKVERTITLLGDMHYYGMTSNPDTHGLLDCLILSLLDVWAISLAVQEQAPNQISAVERKLLILIINSINNCAVGIVKWRDDSVMNSKISDGRKESIKDAYCKYADAFVNINKVLIKIQSGELAIVWTQPDNGENIPLLKELPARQI
jgi:hypothetical protein